MLGNLEPQYLPQTRHRQPLRPKINQYPYPNVIITDRAVVVVEQETSFRINGHGTSEAGGIRAVLLLLAH